MTIPLLKALKTMRGTTLAWIVILLSIFITLYSWIVLKQIVLIMTGVGIGLSGIAYFICSRRSSTDDVGMPDNVVFNVLASLFFFYLALLIISIYFRPSEYERGALTIGLLFSLGLLTAIIVYVCPNRKPHRAFIIIQIICCGILVQLSQSTNYASINGIDTWVHQRITNDLVHTGFVPLGTQYSGLPGFHILLGSVMEVLGVNYISASTIIIPLIDTISIVLLTYLIGRSLFNTTVGLYASLVVVFANSVVGFGLMTIPNTIGGVLLLVALYLLIRNPPPSSFSKGCMIIVFASLMIMHTISSFALITLLFVWVVTKMLWGDLITTGTHQINDRFVLYALPALIGAMLVIWYFAGALDQIAQFFTIDFDLESTYTAPLKIHEYASSIPTINLIFNNLGRVAFFSLALAGTLLVFGERETNIERVGLAFSGVTLVLIGYLSFLFSKQLIPGRWWFFGQLILVLPLAYFITKMSAKGPIRRCVIISAIAFLIFFLMVSPDARIDDNETFVDGPARLALTTSEAVGAEFIKSTNLGQVNTDSLFSMALRLDYKVNAIDNSRLFYDNEFYRFKGTFVIREDLAEGKPFFAYDATYALDYNPLMSSNWIEQSKMYDNNGINLWVNNMRR